MLPSLRSIEAGLGRTTEALAAQLAAVHPATATPDWSAPEWQLAAAAAAAHGVSPLLSRCCAWQNPGWQSFLQAQREHVMHRHRRIAAVLQDIDSGGRARGLAIVPLKGSALHAMGIYAPGERPMADIDLLVRDGDSEAAAALLRDLGFVLSFTTWKHQVFKPVVRRVTSGLGEHRDTQINIELHTRIREPLPVSMVDITDFIYPREPRPGLNPYPSTGAAMIHLLLHAAGNIRSRGARLLQLNDIARLAVRMTAGDWEALWDPHLAEPPWWALPPLRLTARYYRHCVPEPVLMRLEAGCPALLRLISRRQTLTKVSSSRLWVEAMPGIEWSRSLGEAGRCVIHRFKRDAVVINERAEAGRIPPWMQGQGWARANRGRLILARLAGPVPRPDTLYVVRAAFAQPATEGPIQ